MYPLVAALVYPPLGSVYPPVGMGVDAWVEFEAELEVGLGVELEVKLGVELEMELGVGTGVVVLSVVRLSPASGRRLRSTLRERGV